MILIEKFVLPRACGGRKIAAVQIQKGDCLSPTDGVNQTNGEKQLKEWSQLCCCPIANLPSQ